MDHMHNNSRWKHAALLSMAAAAFLAGCQRDTSDYSEALYSAATVTRGTIADVVVMSGPVVAVNSRWLSMGMGGGRVVELLVNQGQSVQAGQVLLRLDTSDLERKLREAQADLEVAQAALDEAQRQAGEIELAKAEADLASAEAQLASAEMELTLAQQLGIVHLQEAVDDAEVALQVARDQLRLAELGASQSAIRFLEYDLAFYQRTLRDLPPDDDGRLQAVERLAEVQRDLDSHRASREEALRAARDQVQQQEVELAKARTSLARAQSGEENPTDAPFLARQQAMANLEQATRKLESLKVGVDSEAVRAAKTAYDAALAEVEGARAAVDAASLRAPFKGIILAVLVQLSQQVQPTDSLLFLADLDDLRVQAQANEVDIPKLAVGQSVRITFDAYPGELYSGTVLSLPPGGQSQGGVSYYQVETSLEGEGADVRLGMWANARAIIGERSGVLTVPMAALVYLSPDDIMVRVRGDNGKTREQRVTIGLNDGIVAEVLSGLSEGQTVLVPLSSPGQSFWDRPEILR
jgi:RND family efflux transporter MFP subunit